MVDSLPEKPVPDTERSLPLKGCAAKSNSRAAVVTIKSPPDAPPKVHEVGRWTGKVIGSLTSPVLEIT